MKRHKNIYKIVTKLHVYEHLKNDISNNAKIIQIKKGILKLIAQTEITQIVEIRNVWY